MWEFTAGPRFNDPAEQLMAGMPHWQPYNPNAKNNHRKWRWTAPDGAVHTVGCGSGGHSTNDAMTDAKFLSQRIRRCEGGACDHAPTGLIDEQHLSAEPAAPLFHVGQQVMLNGQPTWITEMDGRLAVTLDHEGKEDVVPTTDLKIANILDPIHDTLDPRVWDNPDQPEPGLKSKHLHWIERQVLNVLKRNGYDDADKWLTLVFTGSLTTYQYSDDSDVDVSLFVDSEVFPEWSRAELIGLMVENVDGTKLPGTPFPMQCFVVPSTISPDDLYKPGLRSGYSLKEDRWLVAPERDRVKDVKKEMNGMYAYALEQADKMDRLLRYEPDKAETFWHQIHAKRRTDQKQGKGDFTLSNITYKFLANRGLMPRIAEQTGEYIARRVGHRDNSDTEGRTSHLRNRHGASLVYIGNNTSYLLKVGSSENHHVSETLEHPETETETLLGDFRGYEGRRPLVHDEESGITHVGPEGSTHRDLIETIKGKGYPVNEGYAGWMGHNPEWDSGRNPTVVNQGAETEYGWYNGSPGIHVNQELAEKYNANPAHSDEDWHVARIPKTADLTDEYIAHVDDKPKEPKEEPEVNHTWRNKPKPKQHHAWVQANAHQERIDQNAGQNLAGLPGPVNVPGTGPLQFHAHGGVQNLAHDYMREAGLPYKQPRDYSSVDPVQAAKVAAEYDKMPHAPNDPRVRASYEALARETKAQYDHAVKHGYNFEFYPQTHDPYPNSPREAVLDLHHNKHMYVYPTEDGFGSQEEDEYPGNPLLGDSGVRWNGQKVTHNDLFRAVHDFYGHAKEGLGFRAAGEDNAFRQHAAMFSPLARGAMATETRGQNSWVNYGPHGEHNQTAGQHDTVFAPQKTGLLPEWTHDPNLHPDTNGYRTASDEDYRGQHRAPSNNGDDVAMHEMHKLVPDVYQNPRYYMFQPEHDKESWKQIIRARGNPEHMVTIHRSGPTNVINPGDWVTPARSYAVQHGMHHDDPSKDMPVTTMQVPAKHLFWDGNDMNEFGYDPSGHLAKTASVPATLHHWTDARNLGDWKGPNAILPHGVYMTQNHDVNDWNPDVPRMEYPVRIDIDTAKLEPHLFGMDEHTGEGYVNGEVQGNHYYKGRIPQSAIKGFKKFKAPAEWDDGFAFASAK